MIESIVRVSMRDDNDLNCSYAIISKDCVSVIVVLKDSECAIFDYNRLKKEDAVYEYLLLKHYSSDSCAYKDFLKLLGKMCKKDGNSKYFHNHIKEDNRMVVLEPEGGHMISEEEKAIYEDRYLAFEKFILQNKKCF